MKIVTEIWRPVSGRYAKWPYEVSTLGRIRSTASKRILKQQRDRDGYFRITLSVGGEKISARTHRLVAIAFVPNRKKSRTEINHKNGIKSDNRHCNLEWVTKIENLEHAVANGLKASVGACPRKMTVADAALIRSAVIRGIPQRFLSRWFGVTQPAISCVVRNKTYKP